MRLAPACSALLRERDNTELAETLDLASHERQQYLANSISDAILMGPEWKAFWERPNVLAHYPDDTSSRMTAVLAQLAALSAKWLAGDWAASNREFELLLSELRAGDGGALIPGLLRCVPRHRACDPDVTEHVADGTALSLRTTYKTV